MPWQHLRKAVVEMAIISWAKKASDTRTHLNDTHIVKSVMAGLGQKEKRIYSHVSSGGAWADSHLKEIGLSDGKCPHCGTDVEDFTHITWQCEAIHKHRKVDTLKDVDHMILPSYIKHGVPKAMSTDVEGTFWGDRVDQSNMQCKQQTCKAIGLQSSNKGKVIASCKHQEVKDVLSRNGIDQQTHNARQAFSKIKANKMPPHIALPYKCHRKAPSDINVYTDGSWINPLQQYLGLGGAGFWWPGRDQNVFHRLSQAEKDLAYSSQHADGLMLYTPIGGYTGSSTRTELAAAIIALAANGPVHIGTDSQVFHDKALLILGHLRKGKRGKSNWQLVSDGDLWYHFEMAAKAKGPKAIRISKVKGHVKQVQVDDGIYTQRDKDGNDQADHAADLATQMHGADVVSMASILHKRHDRYTAFMKQVAKHIIEAYLIHRKLLDKLQDGAPSKQKKVDFQPLQRQSASNNCEAMCKFNLQGSIQRYKAFRSKHKCSDAVWDFLQGLDYVDADHQYHATTWLELYLIYRITNHPKPIPDNASKARSRATVLMQLSEFKKVVRGIVDRGIWKDEQKARFKPIKVTHERFLFLGIKGKQAALSCSIVVDDEIAGLVESSLITLGHRVSATDVRKFREGNLSFYATVPNLRGRVGWDSNIKVCAKYCCVGSPSSKQASAIATLQRVSNPVRFRCPACNASELSSNQAFQLADLDKTCKCKSCKATSKIKSWRCGCSTPWHLCTLHQFNANSNSKKPPSSGTTSNSKRKVGPLTYEQLQELGTKRIRKSNFKAIPPAPNILSAKLRERFAYLF